jgi:hypothetical protein
LPTIADITEGTEQKLTAGYRNVWDDLVTLVYGVYGYIFETNQGDINMRYPGSSYGLPPFGIGQDSIGIDISASDSVDKIRNLITITEFDGVESTYFDDDSISLYQERSGELSTYLTNTLEAADVGQRILNALAFPVLTSNNISVNLLNPSLSNLQRDLLLNNAVGSRWNIDVPITMGGLQTYLVIGSQLQISKDSFILNMTTTPYSSIINSKLWHQIPYNYTWTSYGVAFPTQEWQEI